MRRGRDFWRRLVDEVEAGAAVAEVARRHRVQPRTLSWWKWKLGTLDGGGSTAGRGPALLPVIMRRVGPDPSPSGLVELCLGDVVIRVRADADVEYVAALVDALLSRC